MAAPKTLLALYGVSSRILINGAEGIVVGGAPAVRRGKGRCPCPPGCTRWTRPWSRPRTRVPAHGTPLRLAVPVVSEAVLRGLLAWPRDRQGGPETDAEERLKGLVDRREFLPTVADVGLGR